MICHDLACLTAGAICLTTNAWGTHPQAGPKTVTNTTRTEQCVSLGLSQFLDRIAVQKQDRKLEPFFGFSPVEGSAAQPCCERALCSTLRVGAVCDAPQNEPCSPKARSPQPRRVQTRTSGRRYDCAHTRTGLGPPPSRIKVFARATALSGTYYPTTLSQHTRLERELREWH